MSVNEQVSADGHRPVSEIGHTLVRVLSVSEQRGPQSRGRVKQKVLPWPIPSDSTQIRPPWARTMRRQEVDLDRDWLLPDTPSILPYRSARPSVSQPVSADTS